MRTSVATLGGVSILFVGVYALSEAASQSEATATETESGTQAWDALVAVTDGIGQAAAPGVVWMGAAAFIVVALGYLVLAAGAAGGGR